MTTSYRNVFLLACCQALLLTNAAGLITMNGLVGYSLVDAKTVATLGATTYVLGSALPTMPMSLWMAKVGRRRGFMTGALINIVGCGVAVLALWMRSFALYCVATAVIGIYNAIGLQYRFAAAEVATKADRARAISLVLAGGIVGGFSGRRLRAAARTCSRRRSSARSCCWRWSRLVALAVQSHVEVPKPTPEESAGGGRPLREIVRQPVFVVAALAGDVRLRPHEPADDRDAARDGLLRPSRTRWPRWSSRGTWWACTRRASSPAASSTASACST